MTADKQLNRHGISRILGTILIYFFILSFFMKSARSCTTFVARIFFVLIGFNPSSFSDLSTYEHALYSHLTSTRLGNSHFTNVLLLFMTELNYSLILIAQFNYSIRITHLFMFFQPSFRVKEIFFIER